MLTRETESGGRADRSLVATIGAYAWNGLLVAVYVALGVAISLPAVALPGVTMWWLWGRIGWTGPAAQLGYFLVWIAFIVVLFSQVRRLLLGLATLVFHYWRGGDRPVGGRARWR